MTRLLSALAVLAATVVTVQAVPVQSPPAGVFGGPISPSNPHGIAPPMPGYGVQNITWKILVDPKNKPGELTTFAGTIQQAVAQAVAINPNYLADHGLDAARYDIHKHHNMTNPIPCKGNSSDIHHLPPPHPPYHKLDGEDKQVNDLKCFDEDLPGANLRAIDMGIDYLNSLSGVPGNGVPGEDAAPKNCGRVSCSWGSAIWWCNDVSYHPSRSLVCYN